ncbi:hypothetical protein DFH09DRAFT_1453345 [Mycena vulgaris]|nr:hypothetical protein DFH09DRAFT_1453345 [Mycena vulgaris]
MSGVVALMGQGFYAYRVYVLSKSRLVPLSILAISLTSSVAAFVMGAFMFQVGDLTLLENYRTKVVLVTWCATSALCDILIAIWMTFYLSVTALM